MEEEKSYQFWLHNIPEAGERTIEKILKEFGSARWAYLAGADALRPLIRGKGKEKIDTIYFQRRCLLPFKTKKAGIPSLCIILSWQPS